MKSHAARAVHSIRLGTRLVPLSSVSTLYALLPIRHLAAVSVIRLAVPVSCNPYFT